MYILITAKIKLVFNNNTPCYFLKGLPKAPNVFILIRQG